MRPDFALPPRLCSKTLVQELPPLALAEADAAPYAEYLRRLVIAAERKTPGNGLAVQLLADYALRDWPALQIVKSWRDFRPALHRDTRLLVCLDNRVDDDLHQCTEFRLHRDRVRTIAEQLAG